MKLLKGQGFKLGFVPIFHFPASRSPLLTLITSHEKTIPG